MKKKAQSGIVTLIVGVAVAILALIFMTVFSGKTFTLVETDLQNVANNQVILENITITNGTIARLDHSFIQVGTLALQNGSGKNFGLGNFTIDYDAGTLLLFTNKSSGQNFNANYTWGAKSVRTSAQRAIISGFDAMQDTGSYIVIVVLAIIIAFVIGTIMMLVTRGGGSSGGTSL